MQFDLGIFRTLGKLGANARLWAQISHVIHFFLLICMTYSDKNLMSCVYLELRILLQLFQSVRVTQNAGFLPGLMYGVVRFMGRLSLPFSLSLYMFFFFFVNLRNFRKELATFRESTIFGLRFLNYQKLDSDCQTVAPVHVYIFFWGILNNMELLFVK